MAAKITDFGKILPRNTRIYIAHIEGTSIDDMVATAARLSGEGFTVMPHIPARLIKDRPVLREWLARYSGEAGITEALVLAGSRKKPCGCFASSMQLLDTGLFDSFGFGRLHVAGHPEGCKDIDRDGSTRLVDDAAHWKHAFAQRTDIKMAMVSQFAFLAEPVLGWADRLLAAGIDLPIHVGIAGPAKLHALIKYALACGVGPSLKVLERRARDMTKLLLPFEPTGILNELAALRETGRGHLIEGIHIFPLGGIAASAAFIAQAREVQAGGQVGCL